MTISGAELAQILTACGVILTAISSLWNGFMLKVIHKNTNSLAKRNEELANKVGQAIGLERAREERPEELR